MKLLEVIPTPRHAAGDRRSSCASSRSSGSASRVVLCKDTPNFIANRLASVGGASLVDFVLANGYTVEEADAIAGPLIGRPKTAAFRLQDLVGLDVSSSVAANLYGLIEDDESREVLALAARRGAARRADGARPPRRQDQAGLLQEGRQDASCRSTSRPASIASAASRRSRRSPRRRRSAVLPERLQFVLRQDDKAGALARHIVYNSLGYASRRVPEISDRPGEHRPRRALGLLARPRPVRAVGRARRAARPPTRWKRTASQSRRGCARCSPPATRSFYRDGVVVRPVAQDVRPGPARSAAARAEATCRSSREQRREPARPRRRRALPRVPHEDEHARRRHPRDARRVGR